MNIFDAGHRYALSNLDALPWEQPTQQLYFVKREGEKFPGNVGKHHGTTSQEVLRALIDRAAYVNGQIPCWQTRLSILLMGLCVWLYEQRAARRHGRSAPSFYEATYGQCCQKCGHVGCRDAKPNQAAPKSEDAK